MPKPLKGEGYDLNSTNRGFSLDIHAPDYVEPNDGFFILYQNHPFKVIFTGVDSSGEEPVNKFIVIPGTVNNVIPNNINDEFTAVTVEQKIYLKVPIDDTVDPPVYPGAPYVEIVNTPSDEPFVDTDTEGYLLLATMGSDGTITQFVQGSVWSERHKYTEPDTATYYYYRV
jgi:hypothetical protein